MRLSEDLPLDPQVLAELEAIDATLRGEPVDPAHAEIAELALLLADQRVQMPAEAAQSLDATVARRFAPAPSTAPDPHGSSTVGSDASAAGPSQASRRPRLMRWALRPSFGIAFAGIAAAAVAGVIVLNNHSPNSPNLLRGIAGPAGPPSAQPQTANGASTHSKANSSQTLSPATTTSLATPPAGYSTGPRSPAVGAATLGADHSASGAHGAASGANGAASSSVSGQPAPISGFAPADTASAPSIVPTPPGAGRKQIQSAQLQLSTPGGRINQVSQELFNVVGFNGGIVQNSQITAAGPNGYAYFQLSIPSANLTQTMGALSTLRYAHVVARTDSTQDITNQYNAAVRRLADARALRTALLKQLAAATTEAQIISLTTQIHDAEASISSDEAALAGLNHQVSYSSVQVQINAAAIPPVLPSGSSSHGFGLGSAWHDSVRVLTVAAGAALIALAVLIPLSLVGAFVAWIVYWVRRRRREAALDAAM